MQARLIAAILLAACCYADRADAQTWSVTRARPALWQISAIDASGEPGWPYGREDVAGDGLDTFEDDEAGADLRTVYADADDDTLFIRAYVASTAAPPDELIAFFFLDVDQRDSTGGNALGDGLWSEWDDDPSAGGYERAVGVRGDGSVVGAYEYRAGEWMELEVMLDEIEVEVGVDRDPIRLIELQHGYVQVVLSHQVFGLDAGCEGDLFVRLWHDATPRRSFGDDDDSEASCRPRLDQFGDPVVLRVEDCTQDAQCPGDGECIEGVCVFGYECTRDADCRDGEECSAGVCVREPGDACSRDADCDGLICDDGECAACSDSGSRACEGEAVCAPNGACLAPDGRTPAALPGQVRGGAFECAATRQPRDGTMWPALLLLLAALLPAVRTRRGRR